MISAPREIRCSSIPDIHDKQGAENVERQRQSNNNPAAHPHKYQQHADDNRRGHQKIGNKAIDRVGDLSCLIVKNSDVDARRFVGGHLLEAGLESVADVNNVDARIKETPMVTAWRPLA